MIPQTSTIAKTTTGQTDLSAVIVPTFTRLGSVPELDNFATWDDWQNALADHIAETQYRACWARCLRVLRAVRELPLWSIATPSDFSNYDIIHADTHGYGLSDFKGKTCCDCEDRRTHVATLRNQMAVAGGGAPLDCKHSFLRLLLAGHNVDLYDPETGDFLAELRRNGWGHVTVVFANGMEERAWALIAACFAADKKQEGK